MLDLFLKLLAHGGRVSFSIHTKPTSQWTPLSSWSGHPRSVHLGWPKAMVQRHKTLSLHKHDALKSTNVFRQQLQEAEPRHPALAELTSPALKRWGFGDVQAPQSQATDQDLWLVLPFHPAWAAAGLAKILRWVNTWLNGRGCPSTRCRLRISWALGGPHLARRIAGLARHI